MNEFKRWLGEVGDMPPTEMQAALMEAANESFAANDAQAGGVFDRNSFMLGWVSSALLMIEKMMDDDGPSEGELERRAERVGTPLWRQV